MRSPCSAGGPGNSWASRACVTCWAGLVAAALLSCVAAVAPAAAAAATLALDREGEAGAMQELRQALLATGSSSGTAVSPGWRRRDALQHCQWEDVQCSGDLRVTGINIFDGQQLEREPTRGGAHPLRLPASLSRFEWLNAVIFSLNHVALAGPLPTEWFGVPQSFPRMHLLSIWAPRVEGNATLPAAAPGALPHLKSLVLRLGHPPVAAPASWGAIQGVLPSLQSLSLGPLCGPLPAAWAAGFLRLRRLELSGSEANGKWDGKSHADACVISESMSTDSSSGTDADSSSGGRDTSDSSGSGGGSDTSSKGSGSDTSSKGSGSQAGTVGAAEPPPPRLLSERAAAARVPPQLPANWAADAEAFQALQYLKLTCLPLAGSLPLEWAEGGFPALVELHLSLPGLTGTLPPQLLHAHPRLEHLLLTHSQLSGPLPDPWAKSMLALLDLSFNALTGPAFPPAWLRPNSFRRLTTLTLSGNSGLSGTLPPNLSWPSLAVLNLAGTSLQGRIPDSWCQGLLASGLEQMSVAGTGVEAALPPCAPQASREHVFFVNSQQPHSRLDSQPGRLGLAAPAALATALPLVALLSAFAAAGRLLWRRGVGSQARGQAHGTSLLQLPHYRDAADSNSALEGRAGDGLPGNSTELAAGRSSAVAGARSVVGRTRGARLASLIQVELGNNGKKRSVQMLPLHAFRKGLAHELGSDNGGGAAATQSSERGTAGEVSPLLLAAGSVGSTACQSQHAPPSQWGLPTDSLHLQSDELVFVCGSQELIILGEGANAVVMLARLRDEQNVAVKVFEVPAGESHAVWQEVGLLLQCTHPRIVPLLGVAMKGPLLMVVMGLMEGGSLGAALKHPQQRQGLRWAEGGRQVALDVAEALEFLHVQLAVLHSDLKPSNVMLTSDLRACLGDLGVAKVVGSCARSAAGFSRRYAAPEQLMGQRCSLAADMYSFGVLLVELTTLTLGESRGQWWLPRAPEDCPEAVVQLIQECVQLDPLARPTATQALHRLRAAG